MEGEKGEKKGGRLTDTGKIKRGELKEEKKENKRGKGGNEQRSECERERGKSERKIDT